jgi:GTP-binding protein
MADSINYQLAKFVASYGKVSQIPESTCPEVSFVGRSNVGKSSIMNKLFGRKNLVKVSSTPGKTSNINFFEADDVHFVDLPGYGFARRSKAERDRWAELIGDFFDSERSFNLVVSLVDIRHDPSKLDHDMIDYLQGNEFNFIVCLTKADKPHPAGPPGSSHQKAAQRSGRERDHHKLPDRHRHRRTQKAHRRGLPLIRPNLSKAPICITSVIVF